MEAIERERDNICVPQVDHSLHLVEATKTKRSSIFFRASKASKMHSKAQALYDIAATIDEFFKKSSQRLYVRRRVDFVLRRCGLPPSVIPPLRMPYCLRHKVGKIRALVGQALLAVRVSSRPSAAGRYLRQCKRMTCRLLYGGWVAPALEWIFSRRLQPKRPTSWLPSARLVAEKVRSRLEAWYFLPTASIARVASSGEIGRNGALT